MHTTAFQLILQSGFVIKAVLLILLFFSVVSWAIIFLKYRHLSAAGKQNSAFLRSLMSNRDPEEIFALSGKHALSPISRTFRAAYTDLGSGRKDRKGIRRALRRYEAAEGAKLEHYLGFLATTSTVTPFLGLFGTVWGIMNSFSSIGVTGSASLAVVAPGIAGALTTTAMGLAAAIPAVVAYNYYISKTRQLITEMEDFSEEILELIAGGGGPQQ